MNPTIITGIVEIIILKINFLLLKRSNISFLKYTITARNEPMCKLTSIDKLFSSKSRYSDTNIKWEEELMGKNSVIPWTAERINISIIV